MRYNHGKLLQIMWEIENILNDYDCYEYERRQLKELDNALFTFKGKSYASSYLYANKRKDGNIYVQFKEPKSPYVDMYYALHNITVTDTAKGEVLTYHENPSQDIIDQKIKFIIDNLQLYTKYNTHIADDITLPHLCIYKYPKYDTFWQQLMQSPVGYEDILNIQPYVSDTKCVIAYEIVNYCNRHNIKQYLDICDYYER